MVPNISPKRKTLHVLMHKKKNVLELLSIVFKIHVKVSLTPREKDRARMPIPRITSPSH
jgi:hypothetical protein